MVKLHFTRCGLLHIGKSIAAVLASIIATFIRFVDRNLSLAPFQSLAETMANGSSVCGATWPHDSDRKVILPTCFLTRISSSIGIPRLIAFQLSINNV